MELNIVKSNIVHKYKKQNLFVNVNKFIVSILFNNNLFSFYKFHSLFDIIFICL